MQRPTPMVIIAGHGWVAEADRPAHVAAHLELIDRCRKAVGCHDAVIAADPLEPDRVNIYERWESQESLEAWRSAANAPDTGIKLDADDVQLFTVVDARPPFG